MKLAINLLKQKNEYLSQFKNLTLKELQRLQTGDTAHINQFYYLRQIILDAIESIDMYLKLYELQDSSETNARIILMFLQKNRELLKEVLKQDILMHSYLSELKYDVVESQTA